MILVPLFSKFGKLEENQIFPTSVSIIAPICLVSLALSPEMPEVKTALPYLLGALLGGYLAGRTEQKIPVKFLHRVLGGLILFAGVRYLC